MLSLGLGLIVFLLIGANVGLQFMPERLRALKAGIAGFFAIAVLCVLLVAHTTADFEANIFFGSTNKQLIDACVEGLEAGKTEKVLAALKELQKDYRPTYENNGNWDELVERAVGAMSGEVAR